jgi:hypothetical protein
MIYHDYANMTVLGRQVGMTSHQFGKLLVQAGLRTSTKVPSEVAIKYGFVRFVPNGRNDALYPVWNTELTLKALTKLGFLPEAQPNETGNEGDDSKGG